MFVPGCYANTRLRHAMIALIEMLSDSGVFCCQIKKSGVQYSGVGREPWEISMGCSGSRKGQISMRRSEALAHARTWLQWVVVSASKNKDACAMVHHCTCEKVAATFSPPVQE